MRILLTGATGFIGAEIQRQLLAAGHSVRSCVRRPERVAAVPGVEVVAADFARDDHAALWHARLDEVDAVVNAVGIIRERGGASFEAVQFAGPVALFEACAERRLRVVQISAMGADPGHRQPFLSTKGRADARLLELCPNSAVLRPSLVYGEDGESARLFRGLAVLPVVPVPGDGSYLFNPIHVREVARVVVHLLEIERLEAAVYELGGADTLSLTELLLALRAWLGERPTGPVLRVPLGLMKLPAWLGDLSGRGPIDSAQLDLLADGSVADVEPLRRDHGLVAPGLRAELAARPATEAERWHARLAPLTTLLRLLVASIWLVTPTVSLYQWERGLELLRLSHVPAGLGPTLLVGSCGLEYLLALPLVLGRWVRPAAWFSLSLVLFFSAFLSVTQPALWLDPFGPLSKNLPLIGATLALLAITPRHG